MSISVIKLFNKAFKSDEVSFSEINKLAVKVGYIVHPHCCSNEVLQFLKSLPINLNATFYKSWSDIINKNRFELYIDQIKHYASTYGTDFKGEVWTSNEGSEQPDYSDFKVITPITIEEVNKYLDFAQYKIQEIFHHYEIPEELRDNHWQNQLSEFLKELSEQS